MSPGELAAISATLRDLSARIEAQGWPKYSVDPDLCMERAFEFLSTPEYLDAMEAYRRELGQRQGVITRAWDSLTVSAREDPTP